MESAKNRNLPAVVALLLAAALVGGFGQWIAAGSPLPFVWSHAGVLVAEALEAGVVEEVVFRGLVLGGLLSVARHRALPRPRRFALAISSVLFGLMHLLPASSDAVPSAFGLVMVAQAVLKVLQGTLFGLVMGEMTLNSQWSAAEGLRRTRALVGPIAAHTAFDLVYLGPLLLTGAPLPETYLTGTPSDLVPLAISTLILIAAWAFSRAVKREARKAAR